MRVWTTDTRLFLLLPREASVKHAKMSRKWLEYKWSMQWLVRELFDHYIHYKQLHNSYDHSVIV